ncbi:MAG: transcriptional regulator [Archangium gephyra]|uniref:Transcriptional regulator n=1 Tax=Archangium gephyra TaxID=48 RepID=A0A2W5SY24_9BACT|nr:MAG: transcriptional regulator [Archangium gephyra]
MTPPDYLDFGRYLQVQRELRGLSLDDVARQTKIPPTLIGALESGQSERFPERVFILNYIRSYATAVGLSPDEAVNRFHEIPEAPKAEAFDPAALETVRLARASSMLWSTIAAVLVLAALLTLNGVYELTLRYTHR